MRHIFFVKSQNISILILIMVIVVMLFTGVIVLLNKQDDPKRWSLVVDLVAYTVMLEVFLLQFVLMKMLKSEKFNLYMLAFQIFAIETYVVLIAHSVSNCIILFSLHFCLSGLDYRFLLGMSVWTLFLTTLLLSNSETDNNDYGILNSFDSDFIYIQLFNLFVGNIFFHGIFIASKITYVIKNSPEIMFDSLPCLIGAEMNLMYLRQTLGLPPLQNPRKRRKKKLKTSKEKRGKGKGTIRNATKDFQKFQEDFVDEEYEDYEISKVRELSKTVSSPITGAPPLEQSIFPFRKCRPNVNDENISKQREKKKKRKRKRRKNRNDEVLRSRRGRKNKRCKKEKMNENETDEENDEVDDTDDEEVNSDDQTDDHYSYSFSSSSSYSSSSSSSSSFSFPCSSSSSSSSSSYSSSFASSSSSFSSSSSSSSPSSSNEFILSPQSVNDYLRGVVPLVRMNGEFVEDLKHPELTVFSQRRNYFSLCNSRERRNMNRDCHEMHQRRSVHNSESGLCFSSRSSSNRKRSVKSSSISRSRMGSISSRMGSISSRMGSISSRMGSLSSRMGNGQDFSHFDCRKNVSSSTLNIFNSRPFLISCVSHLSSSSLMFPLRNNSAAMKEKEAENNRSVVSSSRLSSLPPAPPPSLSSPFPSPPVSSSIFPAPSPSHSSLLNICSNVKDIWEISTSAVSFRTEASHSELIPEMEVRKSSKEKSRISSILTQGKNRVRSFTCSSPFFEVVSDGYLIDAPNYIQHLIRLITLTNVYWFMRGVRKLSDPVIKYVSYQKRMMTAAIWTGKAPMPETGLFGCFEDPIIEGWYIRWSGDFISVYYRMMSGYMALTCWIYAILFSLTHFDTGPFFDQKKGIRPDLLVAGVLVWVAVIFCSFMFYFIWRLPIFGLRSANQMRLLAFCATVSILIPSYYGAVFASDGLGTIDQTSGGPLLFVSVGLLIAIFNVCRPFIYIIIFSTFMLLVQISQSIVGWNEQLYNNVMLWLFTVVFMVQFYVRPMDVHRRRLFCEHGMPYLLYLSILNNNTEHFLPKALGDDHSTTTNRVLTSSDTDVAEKDKLSHLRTQSRNIPRDRTTEYFGRSFSRMTRLKKKVQNNSKSPFVQKNLTLEFSNERRMDRMDGERSLSEEEPPMVKRRTMSDDVLLYEEENYDSDASRFSV